MRNLTAARIFPNEIDTRRSGVVARHRSGPRSKSVKWEWKHPSPTWSELLFRRRAGPSVHPATPERKFLIIALDAATGDRVVALFHRGGSVYSFPSARMAVCRFRRKRIHRPSPPGSALFTFSAPAETFSPRVSNISIAVKGIERRPSRNFPRSTYFVLVLPIEYQGPGPYAYDGTLPLAALQANFSSSPGHISNLRAAFRPFNGFFFTLLRERLVAQVFFPGPQDSKPAPLAPSLGKFP